MGQPTNGDHAPRDRMPHALVRPGLRLARDASGGPIVHDPAQRARHRVPHEILEAVRDAVRTGRAERRGIREWLEARHLLESDRARAVEAWGAARLAAEAGGASDPAAAGSASALDGGAARPRGGAAPLRPLAIVPGARFTCHGCGGCCEGFLVAPVSEAERQAILSRAGLLSPHVATPVERWFTPREDLEAEYGAGTHALGKRESGGCVFLGEDRLCEVHRRLGEEVKPLVCRKFPLATIERPDAMIVSIRAGCRTLERSHVDGRPLEEQAPWVEAIAGAPAREEETPSRPSRLKAPIHHASVGLLVRLLEEIHVPFALARTIERRALGLLRAAPSTEAGILAVRDLGFAVARSLEPAPDPALLDLAERLALEATPEELRRLAGPVDEARGTEHLAAIARDMAALIPEVASQAPPPYAGLARTTDELAMAGLTALHLSLGTRAGWPREELGASEEVIGEALRAARLPSGEADPAVASFVRAAFVQHLGGSRPLSARSGFLVGLSSMAVTYAITRATARLLALRAGAPAASAAQWNEAHVAAHAALGQLDFGDAAPVLLAAFEGMAAEARPG